MVKVFKQAMYSVFADYCKCPNCGEMLVPCGKIVCPECGEELQWATDEYGDVPQEVEYSRFIENNEINYINCPIIKDNDIL